MCKQIQARFIDKRFSDARLIQIYMSKQMDVKKVLSIDNLFLAKALYLQWLRTLVSSGVMGARTSPRKVATYSTTKSDLFDGMNDSDDEQEEQPVAPCDTDRVRDEVKAWEQLAAARVDLCKDDHGIVNEFDLMLSLRDEFPLHTALFQQVSAHLAHEGNAEDTFSLSGRLSNDNTHTR